MPQPGRALVPTGAELVGPAGRNAGLPSGRPGLSLPMALVAVPLGARESEPPLARLGLPGVSPGPCFFPLRRSLKQSFNQGPLKPGSAFWT